MSTPPAGPGFPAEVLPLIYDELRRRAASYLRRERRGHSLQPTALVHEAYVRLARNTRIEWRGKTHFLAMAATEMRRVLVDLARKRDAARRGGLTRVTLQDVSDTPPSMGILDLNHALERLERLSARQSRVAELRIFGGLTEQEIADQIRMSERTVREDWRVARAWLARELTAGSGDGNRGP